MSPAPAPTPSTRTTRFAAGVAEALRLETVGGGLLLLGAVVALVWANSPAGDSYRDLLAVTVGPEPLHLDLELREWAADGLLAVFFFVAGIELKQEFVAGELRDPRKAALPIVAAVCGVVVPALIFLAVTAGDSEAQAGWAIPTATDIAFALAVLAVIGRGLPTAVRTFLLTLAVVDDLIAITIIAVAFTDDLELLPLAGALVAVAAFGLLSRVRRTGPVLVVLALVAWALLHASGIHATVAGVLLGMALPVARESQDDQLGDRVEHWVRPFSAGVAVPLFAFASAGVAVGAGLGDALTDPVTLGIVAGLVVGKPIGVLGGTLLVGRLTGTGPGMHGRHLVGVGLLAGVGFTVSLLIGELAFGVGTPRDDHVRIGILAASVLAAALGALVLRTGGARARGTSGTQ